MHALRQRRRPGRGRPIGDAERLAQQRAATGDRPSVHAATAARHTGGGIRRCHGRGAFPADPQHGGRHVPVLLPARRRHRPQPHRARPSAHRRGPLPALAQGHAVHHRRPVLQGRPRQAQRPLPAPGLLRGRVHARTPTRTTSSRSRTTSRRGCSQLVGRAQVNDFFDTTERLPELTLDMPRLPLWDSAVYLREQQQPGLPRTRLRRHHPCPSTTRSARTRSTSSPAEDAFRLAERRAARGVARDVLLAFRARRTTPTTCTLRHDVPTPPAHAAAADLDPPHAKARAGVAQHHRRVQAARRHRAAGGGRGRGSVLQALARVRRRGDARASVSTRSSTSSSRTRTSRRSRISASARASCSSSTGCCPRRSSSPSTSRSSTASTPSTSRRPCAWACATGSRPSATR